ncbi:MAG: amidohydrolase family protein, partial [Lachnospiraceae bacterium]|nr:amidohydrolase family protein [Lachnospiraceae bacterium]
ALQYGLVYNFHQDPPVVEPDMLHTVWCAVNRITRTGQPIGQEQCISVFEALKGITIHGAYAYHEEDRKGTLEAGKLADLVVLDRNPLKTDKMQIRDIQVLETVKEGKTLYRKEE